VIEQRLRTSGLVLAIAAVLVVFVGASIAVASSNGSHSLPVTGIIVEMSRAALLSVFALSHVCSLSWYGSWRRAMVERSRSSTVQVAWCAQIFGPTNCSRHPLKNFSFMQMGGWGYRGSLKFLPAALVTRRGNALEYGCEQSDASFHCHGRKARPQRYVRDRARL